MIKIYTPNLNRDNIGGGFTFIRNFKKALKQDVEFVDSWQKCDIIFIFGITTISDKGEIYEAKKQGKKLVLRVDNIPRKSRNKRMSPTERLAEFGGMADTVVYQSEWCKDYAGYFIDNDNEFIINNGVDTEIFNTKDRNSSGSVYLYIDYNPNPNKRLHEAFYWFDRVWRKDNKAQLILAGNMPTSYKEHPEWNWDVPTGGRITYVGIKKTPEDVAKLMKKCDFLLCPYFAEAYSNTLLEGLSCGLKPIAINPEGGNIEMIEKWKNGELLDIHQMGKQYLEIFKSII